MAESETMLIWVRLKRVSMHIYVIFPLHGIFMKLNYHFIHVAQESHQISSSNKRRCGPFDEIKDKYYRYRDGIL